MAQFGITKYTKTRYPNTYRMIAKTSKNPSPAYYQIFYVSGRKIVPIGGGSYRTVAEARKVIKRYATERLHTTNIDIRMT